MSKKSFFSFILVTLIVICLFPRHGYLKNIHEGEQLIRVGIGAFKDGFYDIAENQFLNFIKTYPNYENIYDIYYLLGKTLLMKGKLKESKTVFLKILKESNNFECLDYTLFWLAEIEIKFMNIRESKKYLHTIINKFPKFEWLDYSYYLLGLIEFELDKFNRAELFFKNSFQSSKNNELNHSSSFWLGILSFKENDYEGAIRYFDKIWNDPNPVSNKYLKYAILWLGVTQFKLFKLSDAKYFFKNFIDKFGNDLLVQEAYWRLGLCEYQLGNTDNSITIFQYILNQFKDSHLVLYTHYLLGKIFLFNGDYASSKKELNFTLDKSRGTVFEGISLLGLFWSYANLGEKEESSRVFHRLQKMNQFEDEKTFIQWLNSEMIFSEGIISDAIPYYFNILNTKYREKALFRIGLGYYYENKFRESITNLDILFLEFPNSKYTEACLFLKGECLIKINNLEKAIEVFDQIDKLKKIDHWHLFALTQIGNIHLARNENNMAEIVFKKIIKYYPNHPLIHYAIFQLGNLYLKKNDLDGSIYYYTKVIQGDRGEIFGETYFKLGEIHYLQKKYEKAFSYFEKALIHLKENTLWFHLTQLEIGNLQRKWGKLKEAKKAYEIVIDQSKDKEMEKAARELLNHIELI